MNSNIQPPSTNMLHFFNHHSNIVLGGITSWCLSILAGSLPQMSMLTVVLYVFNIADYLPYLQAGVYVLAMLVSILTLYKLAIELGWIVKKK